MKHAIRIAGLNEIAGQYDGILCDVWGVLHNGIAAWPDAMEALKNFRRSHGPVVMITNAPRPRAPVLQQLARLAVPDDVFDDVVTSGDVTQTLILKFSREIFHIGPARDMAIFDGLEIEITSLEKAGAVVCTGLADDRTETPEDYRDLLLQLNKRNLPFICANPDIVVEYGDRLLWCAGALARDYRAMGGETHIAGKPYRPIYDRARARLDEIAGKPLARERILAIGDGIATDVAGANQNNLDLLFITAGIHAADYGAPESPDPAMLTAFLARHNATPEACMPRLVW
jgi:HAD superfamily hydrolase (TIGR01459 family)